VGGDDNPANRMRPAPAAGQTGEVRCFD